MLPAGQVLITTEDGIIKNIVSEKEAGDNIEILDGILCPGFVNCHCHIELSHMKGKLPEHTGLVNFVQQVMTSRQANDEEKNEAMMAAAAELYDSGTVAVGDICNTADSILLKTNSPIYWHNFIEVSGFVDSAAEQRLQSAEAILDRFKNELPADKDHQSTLSPHAPYSVSKKLFQLLNEQTADQRISIHNQEAAAENKLYTNKEGDFLNLYKNFGIDISGFDPTGKTSLQSWLPYFNNNQSIISVHNSFISEADIAFVKAHKKELSYCLCINANQYIENTFPPLPMLMANNVNIVLGTDSYASNGQLNIMEEIKTIQKFFPGIPLAIILQWATINGAATLGIENKYGSFEKQKQPGIVLINANSNNASRIL